MRAPQKGTFRTRFLLPGGLLAVATLASLAMFFPGTDAGASGRADTAQVPAIPSKHVTTRSCGTVNVKGVTGTTRNAGNPFNSSSRFCLNGHLISYGSRYITYTNPPRSFITAGQLLFAQTCSSCHGNRPTGSAPTGRRPSGPTCRVWAPPPSTSG